MEHGTWSRSYQQSGRVGQSQEICFKSTSTMVTAGSEKIATTYILAAITGNPTQFPVAKLPVGEVTLLPSKSSTCSFQDNIIVNTLQLNQYYSVRVCKHSQGKVSKGMCMCNR